MKLFLGLLFFVLMAGSAQAAQNAVLDWVDNSNNEDGFNVEKAPVPAGPFTRIGGTPANVVTFTDPNIPTGTQVCYRINAFNAIGASGYTNVVCGTALSVPGDPSGASIHITVQ